MPVYPTADLLAELQQRTEHLLNKAVSEWQMTPPSALLRQPGPNNWSAAQCLAHLNSYGRYYLPEIEKAIQAASEKKLLPEPRFKAGWLGNYFTNLMLPETAGKKMKKMASPKDHLPAKDPDADKVLAEFIEQQEEILFLLDRAASINLNKTRVPISISRFIKLKLGDVFMFLIAHNERHVAQATRAQQPVTPTGLAFDYYQQA